MLKKHSKFVESLLLLTDIVTIALSWVTSYYLRFYSGIVPVYKGIPPIKLYLFLLLLIIPIWVFVFKGFGLYRPKRTSSQMKELFDIAKASTFSVLLLISITYLATHDEFSRGVFLYFWLMNIITFSLSRITFREILRYLRRKGFNLKYILIIGAGDLGQHVAEKINDHPELGLKIAGFLTRHPEKVGSSLNGISILGLYDDVQRIVRENEIDQVFVALPLDEYLRLGDLLKSIEEEMVDINVVPDLIQFVMLRGGTEELDGLPIINLIDSPIYGWYRIFKRITDIVVSTLAIIVLFPLMIFIGTIIRLTSHGPIFYRQERMGLDGNIFNIYKFRSMKIGAEDNTGPVWASPNDPRKTLFGAFLRKTNLDELPQFFNVLRGDMSLVGPRPERPPFIEKFKKEIPKYMFRHKMKAGITGWAQVNGWRGNTSIEKRIEYDLYYIENWSLILDIRILWLTLWKGFASKNAY
ncbi:MAG: undecaprenyl-phosphate glucose phosphotransferase [Thermodesulfobacteriota bacterium]|nr:undecaprenyl-phosphate glucose phosphotransferase [Thermodesulfobacteriota bacterium]